MSDFFVFLRGFTVRYRCFAAVVLTFSILVSSVLGCSPSASEELFFYRDEDLRAEISLSCNGTDSRFLYERIGGVGSVSFVSPEELEGFVIKLAPDGAVIIYDGLEAEAPDALALIPALAGEIFSISPDSVTSVETVESDSSEKKLTKIYASGLSVTVDGDGIPVCAEGVLFGVNFRASISDFAVIPR